jgi:site-specific DNA-adenine methylase
MAADMWHAGRFRELRSTELAPSGDEVDRALRFAYLVWYSYGAKGEQFASTSAKSIRMKRSLGCVQELLAKTAERLRTVQIEQRDFAQIFGAMMHRTRSFFPTRRMCAFRTMNDMDRCQRPGARNSLFLWRS